MDLAEHKEKFDQIIKKYDLFREETAGSIADFLTGNHKEFISVKDFAQQFNMEEFDAKIFLDFINIGLRFKETHLSS